MEMMTRKKGKTTQSINTSSRSEKLSRFWLKKGQRYWGDQHYQQALCAYIRATHFNTQSAIAYTGKGDALYKLAFYGQALIAYEQALHLDPTGVLAYQGKGN